MGVHGTSAIFLQNLLDLKEVPMGVRATVQTKNPAAAGLGCDLGIQATTVVAETTVVADFRGLTVFSAIYVFTCISLFLVRIF